MLSCLDGSSICISSLHRDEEVQAVETKEPQKTEKGEPIKIFEHREEKREREDRKCPAGSGIGSGENVCPKAKEKKEQKRK